jgi:hypothetical protein
LKNVAGTDAPVSAGTPRFKLYTSPNQILSGANPETFSTIPVGTYLLEGFQTGTFWGEEFWNSQQVTVAAGATTTAILARKYPYATSVVMKDVETSATITPGQTIAAGTQVRFEVTVRNDVPGTPLSTQVHFVLDLSQGAAFDYDWPLSPAQVIAGSGGTALYTFTTAINGFQTGQFYFALQVRTDTGTSVVPTDSWTWTQACGIGRISTMSGLIAPPDVDPDRGWTPTLAFIQLYPAGTAARIDPNLRTWIVIHGRRGASTNPWVTNLAGVIKATYTNDQILLLDWSDGAYALDYPIGGETFQEDWIKPTAAWAAGKLIDYGFAGSDLNLIGHSWGGNMSAELAELIPYIRGHTVDLVNSIVALDPARDGAGVYYNPDSPTADGGLPEIDFARNSRFSWAFHSSELGSGSTPPTAHEAFGVNTGGGPSDAHSWVHDVFINMLTTSNPVSQRFTLARLLDQSAGSRTLGPWDPNRYSIHFGIDPFVGGYEGVLTTTVGGQTPYSLTYYNQTTGLEVTEYAAADTTPPTPNPSAWATGPYATGTTSTSMTATTASDPSGVQYFFHCLTSGGHDSGWQASATYVDTGLSPNTTYTYQVMTRDNSPSQNQGSYSTALSATTQQVADTTPPTPNPSAWATGPYATGSTTISMTATTASDPSGVQYFFHCLTAGGHDSGWQASATYQDTGLSPNTTYTYQVVTRDNSSNQNQGSYSTSAAATTQQSADTTPPTPNPSTWATAPYATGSTTISMTAATASDPSGVQYFFHCLTAGGHDSGWQASATYQDTGLSPNTTYTYQVVTRDNSSNQNQGSYSTSAAATTQPTPNPSTWATAPYATGSTTISMTATTASDPSGVQYFFHCLTASGHDSGWQASATCQDTGLSPNTTYSYQVMTRDNSSNQNQGSYSTSASATTQQAVDTTPPTPNPSTWATAPYPTGSTTISMTATTASDPSGVQYFFHCLTAGGHDSGWQASATYQDTGLSPNTTYTYQVMTRDNSSNQNQGSYSTSASATTQQAVDTTPTISVTPTSLSFSAVAGGGGPLSQTVSVSNSGGGTLNWSASVTSGSFVTLVGTTSGANSGSFQVFADVSALSAGTYNGTIRITASGAANTPQDIPVTFAVSPVPTISVTPASLSFSAIAGGGGPLSQTVSVSNSGGGTLNWSAAVTSGAFLTLVGTTSGANSGSFQVFADVGALSAGTYNGTIRISASGASNTPQDIPVSFTVSPSPAPTITTQPANQAVTAGANATFTVAASGTPMPTLQWQVSADGGSTFMDLSNATPYSGVTTATLTITAAPSSLNGARYRAVATNSAGSATSTAATLAVSPALTPTISVTPTSLSFSAVAGGGGPLGQSINVSNSGGGTLNWSAAVTSGTFLTLVGTTSGANSGSFQVFADVGALSAGTYNGTIRISASGASNTPEDIPVTFTVSTAPGTGSLTVDLFPAGAVSAGAQWRVDGGSYHNDGETVTSLTPGSHTVSFKTVTGYTTPADKIVAITSGVNTPDSGTYIVITPGIGSLTVNLFPADAVSAGAQWRVDGGSYHNTGEVIGSLTSGTHTISYKVIPGYTAPTDQTVTINANAQTTINATYTVAVPDWGWSFAPSALGTVSPTDHVYGRATIFNRATSTVPLDLSNVTYGLYDRRLNGIYDCCNYLDGFGRDEAFPWTQFNNQIRAVVLAPGQSHSFDFITETPQFPVGVSPGSYSLAAIFGLFNGPSITNQLTWSVDVSSTIPAITTQPANQVVTSGANATFTVAANGTPMPTLQWQVSADGGSTFMDLSNATPYSGVTTATLTITAAPSSLNGTRYRAVATNSAGSATSTAATLTVSPAPTPTISVTPTSLSFSAVAGGGGPLGQSINVSNSGGGTLNWSAAVTSGAFISLVGTTSGANSGSFQVFADVGALSAGTYNGTIRISASGASNTPEDIPVTFTVSPAPTPTISVTPASLTFSAVAGGGGPLSQTVSVSNSGGGTLNWSASVTSASFLTLVGTTSGANAGSFQVFADVGALSAGTYNGTIRITASGASNTPQDIPVSFTVSPSPAPTITTQPANQAVTAGANATFTVAASGTPMPTLQWQVSTNSGGSWSDLANNNLYSGVTTGTLSITGATIALNGYQYRCVATNSSGSTNSTAAVLTVNVPPVAQFSQQGPKLVGTGAVGNAQQGRSVSLSADGNTAIVGGDADNSGAGAAWVWTRSGGVWTQETKLVGTGAVVSTSGSGQGTAVSLSADGNTAIVGGWNDTGTWVWTKIGGVWTQQGTKLVPSGVPGFGFAGQGYSVALSADGNTAIIGGPYDDNTKFTGAAWVWTRNAGVWTQQGPKLFGSGAVGSAQQGVSVSISADGNTAIVGGDADNGGAGAAWVWTRSGEVWTQETKLVGAGAVGNAGQGHSVSLSSDGNTAIVGGPGGYPNNAGAAWVWIRSGGVWTQQGSKLVGTGADGNASQGYSVSISGDGNSAIVGGNGDNGLAGATWVWTRSGEVWTQQGTKLIGSGAGWWAQQGVSVSISADGNTAIVGGAADNGGAGAAWVFAASAPAVPAFTTQPANQAVTAGANATFTVSASGTPTPTLQWQVSADGGSTFMDLSNATPYSGVTTATLTITAAPSSLNGARYRAVATSSAGSATSTAATLTVSPVPTPTISVTPTSLSFSAVAGGGGPLGQSVNVSNSGAGTLNWSAAVASGAFISLVGMTSGANSGSFQVFADVSALSAGTYNGTIRITASGASNTPKDIPVSLNVNKAASVLTWSNPADITCGTPLGANQLNATANVPGSFAYSPSAGAVLNAGSGQRLSVTFTPSDSANYQIATASVVINVLVVPASITTQPSNQTVIAGSMASFIVEAAGTAPLSYQWWFNGTNTISGTTNAALVLTNVQASDAGDYTVVVTNAAGAVTSAVATLSVLLPPTITTQPSNQTLIPGATTSFSVVAVGTAPLSYQWRKDGADIVGATLDTLTLTNVQSAQAGGYSAVVTNIAGSVTSVLATLSVLAPPTMTNQILVGHNFSVLVSTALGANYTLQYKNTLADTDWEDAETLPGTGSAITLTDGTATNPARFYRVRVQ